LVWLDDDRDGVQDPDELGVGGVTVRLFWATGERLGTLLTDANGNYLFEHLQAGNYWVEFELPEGYAFTDQNQGPDHVIDSDPETISGVAIVLELGVDEVDLTWDAGIYRPLGTLPGCPLCPEWVVFQSNRAGGIWDIYRANYDGSDVLRLTKNAGDNVQPAWRFSGEQIAFASNRDGDWEIYRMDASGGQQVNVTQKPLARGGVSPSRDLAPSWDCYWIAFQSDRDGNWEIYKTDPDGLLQIRLTDNPAADEAPSWSADGQWIAFESNRDGNWELYLMDRDGKQVRRLTTNPAADRNPTWSSDGQWVYFDSDRGGNRDIFKLHVQDGTVVQLTDDPAVDSDPSGVPYCEIVFFESQRLANEDVYRMDEDGTNEVNIILGDGGPAYWSDLLGGLEAADLGYVPPERNNMLVLPLVVRR
jgi:hypothetical protein